MAYRNDVPSGTVIVGGNELAFNITQLYNPDAISFDASTNSLIIAHRYTHNIVQWTVQVLLTS